MARLESVGPANWIGKKPKDPPPNAGSQQHESGGQSGNCLGLDAQGRHYMDLNIAVQQDIKAVQTPAQGGGNQGAPLRGGGIRKAKDGSGHWRWILTGTQPQRTQRNT